jgi:hypothetical protein
MILEIFESIFIYIFSEKEKKEKKDFETLDMSANLAH